jgi:hypothetical protein
MTTSRHLDTRLHLRREGDRIYLLWNLIEVGYWTKEDFARFQYFGDKFWAGNFDEIVLPFLNPPEPSCGNCGKRESKVSGEKLFTSSEVCGGVPLCAVCRVEIEKRSLPDEFPEHLEVKEVER